MIWNGFQCSMVHIVNAATNDPSVTENFTVKRTRNTQLRGKILCQVCSTTLRFRDKRLPHHLQMHQMTPECLLSPNSTNYPVHAEFLFLSWPKVLSSFAAWTPFCKKKIVWLTIPHWLATLQRKETNLAKMKSNLKCHNNSDRSPFDDSLHWFVQVNLVCTYEEMCGPNLKKNIKNKKFYNSVDKFGVGPPYMTKHN